MSDMTQWSSEEEDDDNIEHWKTRAQVAERRVMELTAELQQLRKLLKTDAKRAHANMATSNSKAKPASRSSGRLASEACSFCNKRNKLNFKFCVHCGQKRAEDPGDQGDESPPEVHVEHVTVESPRRIAAGKKRPSKREQQSRRNAAATAEVSTSEDGEDEDQQHIDVKPKQRRRAWSAYNGEDVDTSTTDETDVASSSADDGATASKHTSGHSKKPLPSPVRKVAMGGSRSTGRGKREQQEQQQQDLTLVSTLDEEVVMKPKGNSAEQPPSKAGSQDAVVTLSRKSLARSDVRVRQKPSKSPRGGDSVRISPRPLQKSIKSLLRGSTRTKSMGNFSDSSSSFGQGLLKKNKTVRNSPPVGDRTISLMNFKQTPKGVLFMVSVSLPEEDDDSLIPGINVEIVPRTLQAFRDLASEFNIDLSVKRLTKSSPEKDIASVHAKLQTVVQQCTEAEDTDGALAAFIDPHSNPSALGLTMLDPPPLMQGKMQMFDRSRKWRQYLFILHHNLYCFRGEDALEPVMELPLEYVTVEIVRGKDYPGHCFKLDDLNSGNAAEFSLESTKLVGEWILAIREAKVNRMGLGYWVKDQQEGDDDLNDTEIGPGLEWLLAGEKPPLVSDALDVIGERGVVESTPASDLYIKALTDGGAEGWNENIAEDLMCSPLHFKAPHDLLWNLVVLLLKRSVPRKRKLRTVSVIREWAELHPGDFCGDKQMMAALIGVLSQWDPAAIEEFTVSVSPTDKNETKKRLKAAPRPIRPDMYRRDAFDFIDVHPLEIARQLSLLEMRLFKKIEMRELIAQAWNKKGENLAPNVSNVIQRFNLMSGWITSLLVRVPETRPRVALLARFIDIAGHCLELKNFNSLVEIVSALGTSAVRRLTDTWDLLPDESKEAIAKFRALLETRKNWAVYRQALAEVGPTEACVPYLGLYLTDLTFVDERHKVFLEDKQTVNAEHRADLSALLFELRKFQQRDYCLAPVSYFQEYLMRLDQLDEEEAYKLSLLRQPRKKK